MWGAPKGTPACPGRRRGRTPGRLGTLPPTPGSYGNRPRVDVGPASGFNELKGYAEVGVALDAS